MTGVRSDHVGPLAAPTSPAALLAAAALALLLAACGGPDAAEGGASSVQPAATSTLSTDAPVPGERDYPDVETAELRPAGDTYDMTVTISSAYDSPERYADGWRVLTDDGEVLGEHELTHDHANEQPFTRTQSGLRIPDGVSEVVVEGRDSVNGYGGTTVRVPVP